MDQTNKTAYEPLTECPQCGLKGHRHHDGIAKFVRAHTVALNKARIALQDASVAMEALVAIRDELEKGIK